MIKVPQGTMNLRFKKVFPKISLDIHAPVTKPQIFLQQRFIIREFDETNKESMVIPPGVNPQDIIPPEVAPHVDMVGQAPEGMVVMVPKLVGMKVQWVNVPAAPDSAPDEEVIPLPQLEQE